MTPYGKIMFQFNPYGYISGLIQWALFIDFDFNRMR